MSNSAPKSEEKPAKNKWGVVQWAILGVEMGAICLLITLIQFIIMFGSSGVSEWMIRFIEPIAQELLPFIGIVAALSGLAGWFFAKKQKNPAKSIWSVVEWALWGTLLGVIYFFIYIFLSPLLPSFAQFIGWYFLVLLVVFVALGGMAGWFISKSRRGIIFGGVATGFALVCMFIRPVFIPNIRVFLNPLPPQPTPIQPNQIFQAVSDFSKSFNEIPADKYLYVESWTTNDYSCGGINYDFPASGPMPLTPKTIGIDHGGTKGYGEMSGFRPIESLPYVVLNGPSVTIQGIYQDGAIVIEIESKFYRMEPDQNWTETLYRRDASSQPWCFVKETYQFTNYGLRDRPKQ